LNNKAQKMSKPIVADNKPVPVNLEEGEEYHWCACGRSQSQPFCDGSHRGTDFTPVGFKAEETGEAWLCLCKHTGNPPHCDGTHAKLPFGQDVSPEVQAGTQPTPEEPTLKRIHDMARHGLDNTGHHGEMTAMGVPPMELPRWDEIQILTAQFATKPLMEDVPVGTELVIGPNAKKPLVLDIPLFVSDMSFGALSEEAKVALARGAELAGTGICSGEGGMFRRSNRTTAAISMNWPRQCSVTTRINSPRFRLFISRVGRARRRGRADTCREPR
jgi:CDGSH-type Zn-finger protein